jgi:hypothetical protein
MLNLIVQYNKREKEEGETALGFDGEKVFSPGRNLGAKRGDLPIRAILYADLPGADLFQRVLLTPPVPDYFQNTPYGVY